MLKSKINVRTITIVALLVAVQIVLSRFLSFSVWNLKLGFAFLPIMVAARKLGPVEAILIAGVGDFVGAILFPIGTYFPGFTFTAVLVGMTYGLFLHKKCNITRIIISVLLNETIGTLLLNTLWISLLYKKMFLPIFYTRIVQAVVMSVIEIVIAYFLFIVNGKAFDKIKVEY